MGPALEHVRLTILQMYDAHCGTLSINEYHEPRNIHRPGREMCIVDIIRLSR